MKLARSTVAASLIAVAMLTACSESDTIVALNILSSPDVGEVSTVRVAITQEPTAGFMTEFTPPTVAGPNDTRLIRPRFFERIKLPDSFRTAPATIDVELIDLSGVAFLTQSSTVDIRRHGAIAAYFTFAPEMPDGGAGGAGGGGGAGGAAGGGAGQTGGGAGGAGGGTAGGGGSAGQAGAGG
jgi:hypothetical protein